MTKKKSGSSSSGSKAAQTGGVQVIRRAAEILRMLATARGLSITAVARQVELSRATVYRILTALEEEGLVSTSGPGGYKIGPGINLIAEASKLSSVDDLMPFVRRLSATLNETVDLSILTGRTVTFVEHVVAVRRLQAVSAPGVSFPLHCTANGKAILATMPKDKRLNSLPRELEPFTSKTCLSKPKLERELIEVGRAGWAMDREEHSEGICAVGVAFLAPVDEYWAISVPMPASRFYGNETALAQALLHEAKLICAAVPGFRMTIGARKHQ
jgi:DNA-binding IclR family transcriptional regulator